MFPHIKSWLPARILCLVLLQLAVVGASARGQSEDGLVHVVAANETLTSIADAYGVSVADLIARNAIANPDVLSVGKRLLVLTADELAERERAATEDAPSPQVTVAVGGGLSAEELGTAPVTPASAPKRDPSDLRSEICLAVYGDDNENGILDIGEKQLSGATVILFDDRGAERLRVLSDDSKSQCHELPPGEYTMQAESPAGHGLTTPPQLDIALATGGSVNIRIGAKRGRETMAIPTPGVAAMEPTEPPDEAESSVLLGISGLLALGLAGLALVSGLGLALFVRAR